MQIINLRLNEIIPYDNNPRKNDEAVEFVANSIKEFGFRQPIVLDQNNVIIVGHTRYKAALKLGLETVPCTIATNLTEAEATAYRLADNRLGELADWDFELLDIEKHKVEEQGLDLSLFGFIENNINWDEVAEITEDNFEESKPKCLKCPHCGAVGNQVFFRSVKE